VLVDGGIGPACFQRSDCFGDIAAFQWRSFNDSDGLAALFHDDLGSGAHLLQHAEGVARPRPAVGAAENYRYVPGKRCSQVREKVNKVSPKD
jgi:hypothetical protein